MITGATTALPTKPTGHVAITPTTQIRAIRNMPIIQIIQTTRSMWNKIIPIMSTKAMTNTATNMVTTMKADQAASNSR